MFATVTGISWPMDPSANHAPGASSGIVSWLKCTTTSATGKVASDLHTTNWNWKLQNSQSGAQRLSTQLILWALLRVMRSHDFANSMLFFSNLMEGSPETVWTMNELLGWICHPDAELLDLAFGNAGNRSCTVAKDVAI